MSEALNLSVAEAAAPKRARAEGWLHSPLIDFLGLGGLSLIAFAAAALVAPEKTPGAQWFAAAILVSHFVNNPHFAHSYQIFYRNFGDKIRGRSIPSGLRLRYLFAGVIAPAALVLFLAGSFAAGAPRIMGQAAALMTFLVGWHYVKQGYGMAMVDAALKKRFFNAGEKQALLVNAYATWIFAWMLVNRAVAERDFMGLAYYVFDIPDFLYYPAMATAGASFCWIAFLLAKGAMKDGRAYALNGLFAYAMSLYPWLFFKEVNPTFFIFVPAFHSLQYMTVVWRYEMNSIGEKLESQRQKTGDGPKGFDAPMRLLMFYAVAVALGLAGFWGLPMLLQNNVAYDEALWGGALYLFVFWTFINIHHYMMDNVMWRRDNPDVARNLFGAKK